MIIDPIYEGKSMAGLIDLVRDAEIGPESTVLYAHLGGQPALNAYSGIFGVSWGYAEMPAQERNGDRRI
jgi:1-aminocyclopropane-1-carboxylate deaminase